MKLQSIVDDASCNAELAPALAVAGQSDAPALSIANDVMNDMLIGGPDGQIFPWKWNRARIKPFFTISWQQDYAQSGLTTLRWIEHAFAIDINNTSQPKPTVRMEGHRDLEAEWRQWGLPVKICWLPNDQLNYGTWGQSSLLNIQGLNNPGPGVVYTYPVGVAQTPSNPTTQIQDANGNYLVLTTFGTCGSSAPSVAANSPAGATVADGSCVWTVVDPKGQGFRITPLPPLNGRVWLINPIAQNRPVTFTSLGQLLDPIPDDYVTHFKNGFFAQCYRRSPDAKVRAKFMQEHALWLKSLDNAVRAGNREQDDARFTPERGIMDSGYGYINLGPLYPYESPWSW